jgi:hypothetical protein
MEGGVGGATDLLPLVCKTNQNQNLPSLNWKPNANSQKEKYSNGFGVSSNQSRNATERREAASRGVAEIARRLKHSTGGKGTPASERFRANGEANGGRDSRVPVARAASTASSDEFEIVPGIVCHSAIASDDGARYSSIVTRTSGRLYAYRWDRTCKNR